VTAWITGVARTAYGVHAGVDSIGWQQRAAQAALADAGVDTDRIDGLVTGYSTVSGHLMPANLLAEHLGMAPQVAFGMSVGGATGLAMLATAVAWVESGRAEHVLLVAGENRASGQSRQTSTQTLAQVGHAAYEVPLGGTVPAYYALLASHYLAEHELGEDALAPLAVQMRQNAAGTPGAQFTTAITEDDVVASRPVAEPLRLLDCCPVSDGGAAVVVSRASADRAVQVAGIGQANQHQHVSAMNLHATGAADAAHRALADAGLGMPDVNIFGIYDSFTITVAILLEELGLADRGRSGEDARAGVFAVDGRTPLNTHGGLLSYGHPGVSGGMAHLVEVVTQLRGERGHLQVPNCATGYVHADGGVLSAHVGVVLRGSR
jgi:acetyl-CoA acetyltransferase